MLGQLIANLLQLMNSVVNTSLNNPQINLGHTLRNSFCSSCVWAKRKCLCGRENRGVCHCLAMLSHSRMTEFVARVTQELEYFSSAILADSGPGVIPSVLQRRNNPMPGCVYLEEQMNTLPLAFPSFLDLHLAFLQLSHLEGISRLKSTRVKEWEFIFLLNLFYLQTHALPLKIFLAFLP